MIKILHVISDANIGGAGRWMLNFLQGVNREKYFIKVVLPSGSLLTREITALGIETIEVSGMADKSFDSKIIRKLYEIIKEEKPQILHTHASLSARIAGRMARVANIIHTKHCIDEIESSSIKKSIKAVINHYLSDQVIAVSDAVKENLMFSGVHEKRIHVIYNGTKKLHELSMEEKVKLRQSLHIDSKEIVVGMVARLEEVKGHDDLIEAAKLVVQRCKDVRFLVVGTGSKKEKLEEKVKKIGLEEYVIFTGYIQEIGKIMNIIDINVISSLSEALCLSLIEGMSLGKPSIGTAVGGIPEVVIHQRNGLLVPVHDPQALASAIVTLIENPELRDNMGIVGKQMMEEKFTSEEMIQRIEKLYEEVNN